MSMGWKVRKMEGPPHHHAFLNCYDNHNLGHMKKNGPMLAEPPSLELCAQTWSATWRTSAFRWDRFAAAGAALAFSLAFGVRPSCNEVRQGSAA